MTEQVAKPVEYGDREAAERGQILRTVVGSGVHGIAIEGRDDRDEMGVYIEYPERILGIDPFRESYIMRTQPEGARSGPGDLDLTSYELRKYLRLAVKGNPTALLSLWCPMDSVIHMNATGADLRKLREHFLSVHAIHRFLGYMRSQQERMNGDGKQNRVPWRPELIEQYGWDVKFGSHALRLAYQGHEIATTGQLTLPMPEDQRMHVLAVKRGEFTRESVDREITLLSDHVEDLLMREEVAVPEDPDYQLINTFAVAAHKQYWETWHGK